MLENTKKTIENKHFLPLLFIAIPLVASAFSVSDITSFFRNGAEEKKESKRETLQSLKVFEPNKNFSENEQKQVNKLSVVDNTDVVFDPQQEFVDDLDSGISEHLGENAVYTVQKGDSIYSIASYFGVSVETIVGFNHMSSKAVHPGQILEVPSESGIVYTIKKGDTLSGLSKKYNIDPSDITLYNGLLSGDELAVGDEIFLPGAKDEKQVKQTSSKNGTKNTSVKSSVASGNTTFSKDLSQYIPSKWVKGDTSHLNTPAAVSKYSTLPKYDGYYLFPTPGATRTQKMHGNNGCDLANKLGAPVLAAADGVVIVAKTGGYNFGYGNYIKIKHSNGTETLYGHLSRVDVAVGETVTKGVQIGAVGSTGNSTGPHLHFEVHGAYNPFAW